MTIYVVCGKCGRFTIAKLEEIAKHTGWRAMAADVYENWTDVSGFLMADPRIVANPQQIRTISYKELRELSYMGASVLHEDAIYPARMANVPINIRNTNAPEDPGTRITWTPSACHAANASSGAASVAS